MRKLFFTLILFFGVIHLGITQDFMIQGWYWDYPKTCNGNNWAQTLQGQVNTLQSGGFTYVWLPPLSRASFGSCSNGYDPKDLYDLGEYGLGATGFGTRTDVDNLISALNNAGIKAVADIVLNHRDGGVAEDNSAVKDYITTYYSANKNPFPSDRFRCILLLGGTSGNGAGDYYFKISSKTADSKFFGKAYKVYMETGTVGWQNLSDMSESEPNGGGDCSEPNNTITLGRNWLANVDASGCLTDEFHLSLSASDFNAAGDTLFIYLSNLNGDYSDHRIYGIWSASAGADIVSQLKYQTYTDFTNMPSGQGSMNFENFKPNTGNAATTWLTGDWDWLWFFYDYDQSVTGTQNALNSWVEWLWTNVGIRGYRMDAVKHFDYAYTGDLYDYLHGQGIDPGMVVGEFFDTNAGTLKAWIDNVQANMNTATKSAINVRAFDFSLRAALKEACDNAFYDVRNVFNAGIVDAAGGSGFNVVTFLNNHDYRDAGQPIQNDPILGYAYILTNNQIGIPCVFYPEYFGTSVPNYPTVNLQSQIDALIAAHKTYIFGATHREYLSRIGTPFSNSYTSGNPDETLFFQLHGGVGGKEVLVCINFSDNALNMTHQINSDLDGDGNDNFPVGQTFSEVFSYSSTPTLTANSNYEVNIQLPAKSYSVWVEGSVLPLDLVAFNANAQPDRVELNWETAFEADFEGFEIQKALDAAHFKPIGFVEAKAPQNGGAQYTFFDADPVFDRPMYYRLKMKDLNGQFQYSKIVAVEMNEPVHSLALRPNPVKGPAILSFNAQTEGTATLRILDTFGEVLWEQNLEILPGINEIPLALDNLPEGLYFLKMTLENGAVFIQKFVKSI